MKSVVKFKDSELIAKRWASALMELALEHDGISKEEILDDLIEVNKVIENSKELADILNNPSVSTDEKQVVLTKLFKSNVMPIVYNFIISLNAKGRLTILSAIAEEFRKELENIKNILRVEITSAIDLSDDKKNEIRNKIADKLKKNVVPEWNIDSDIIGGLIFTINETIIDNSIKHKLENISKTIIKG